MNRVYRNVMRIFTIVSIFILSFTTLKKAIVLAEGTGEPTKVEFLDNRENQITDSTVTIKSDSTKAYFYVKIYAESGKFNVYLETSDGTLLSSQNEYTEISSNSIYATGEVDTDKGYALVSITVEVAKKVKDYVQVEDSPNYFYVSLVKINNTSYNRTLTVNCESTYIYETKQNEVDKGYVLKLYESITSQTLINDSKRVDNGRNSVTKLDINLSSSYNAKSQALIANKFANYYVSTEGKQAWDNSFKYTLGLVEYNMYSANIANPIYTTAYITNTWSGWDSVKPGRNAAYGDSSDNWKLDNNILTKNIFEKSNGTQNWHDHTYVTKDGSGSIYYFAESSLGNTYYQIDNSTLNNPYLTITNYSGAYNYANYIATCGNYEYTDTDWKGISYKASIDTNRKLDMKSWSAKSFIADTTAPTVSGAYLVNSNKKKNFAKGDKVQIAVRFSEPVQVLDTKNLKIQLTTNSYNANINPVRFDYKSGSGTYTLIFEAESSSYSSKEVNITSISTIDFINANGGRADSLIRDYSSSLYTGLNSKNKNSQNNAYLKNGYYSGYSYSTSIEYNVDTRSPKVTITPNTKTLSKEKDISIQFGNVGTNATFYYKLIKEADLAGYTDEDYEKDLSELDTTSDHIISDGNKTGKYYFYYKIVTYYGVEVSNKDDLTNTNKKEDYALLYDNSAPVLTDENGNVEDVFYHQNSKDEKDNIKNDSYDFTVYLKDLEESYVGGSGNFSRIKNISFIYSENDFSYNSNIGSINLYSDSSTSYAKIKCDSTNKYKYTFTISYDMISDTLVDKSRLYSTLYVGIEVEDTSGNIYTYTNQNFAKATLKFDSRTKLAGIFSYPDEENKIYGLDVYKKGSSVSFTADSSVDVTSGTFTALVYKISYLSDSKKTQRELVSDDSNVYTFSAADKTATIKFNQSGYYEYQFVLNDKVYSEANEIYIGSSIDNNETSDKTYNTTNSEVVINNVWSTNSLMYYYYNDSRVITERYNGVVNPQMFSSKSYLQQYIKYYEYQDLSYVITTSQIATSLNGSASSTYQKATGETRTASTNEIWIRYKKASWNYSNSTTEWVYYYYGEYNGSNDYINVLNLSQNLKNAINSVVSTIVSKCSNVNLVTEEYLNNGVPTLAKNQVHPDKEEAKTSKSGITLQNVNFVGDAGIYSSYKTIKDNNFYYFSNYKFVYTPYTKFYYANVVEDKNFEFTKDDLKSLDVTGDKTLNHILESGTYVLIEVDENGISKTFMYIVNYKDAPSLNISYSSKTTTDEELTLSYANNGERFNATSFAIKSLGDSVDDYAYVRVSTRNTVTTYYSTDFKDGEIEKDPVLLKDGTYTIFVSDRFGNSYSFTVSVNSSDIKYTFNTYDSEYVRFTCELEEDDVFSFSISLNGEVITNQYQKSIKLTKSGTYILALNDIYGNSVNETVVLERKNPEVSWWYVSGNSYEKFDETSTTGAIIDKISTSSYEIYTSSRVQFQYTGDYSYQFSDGVNYTQSSYWGSQRVTITSEEYFTVKIYYTDYEEAQVTYTVIFDKEAADIKASVNTNEYTYKDLEKISTGDYKIDDIGFDIKSTDSFGILNNGQIYSENINLNVTDDSGIKALTITLNGNALTLSEEIQTKILNKDKSISLTLTEIGKYQITAVDRLGNESTFAFENVEPNYFGLHLDDNKVTLNTNPEEALEKSSYGHASIVYSFNEIEQIVYLIDGTYFTIIVRDNALYVQYLGNDEHENYGLIEKTLINDITTSSEYAELDVVSIDGIKLSYRKLDGSFYFMITALNSNVHNVVSRTISDYSYVPFYNKVELCGKLSSLDFINKDNKAVNVNALNGYTNLEFTIRKSTLDSDITKIEYAENSTNNFDNITLKELDLTSEFTYYGTDDGYFKFKATNKYGMVTSYIIRVFRQLLIEVDAKYSDNTKISYIHDGSSSYFSNNKVVIRSFDSDSKFTIEKESEEVKFDVTRTDDYAEVTISGNGVYLVTIVDNANNTRIFNVTISDDSFNVTNDIFKGLSKDALKELYSKDLVSIDKSLFDTYQIYRVEMAYKDDEYLVYYDNISQEKITNISLTDLVGSLGDGVYKVRFRNICGTECLKEIHYSATSTLDVERMTRSDFEYSALDINKIDEGAYSNNLVRFKSTAKTYDFKIDGNKVDCPYELSFPKTTTSGTYTYSASYVDEYGFKYEFTVYLIRQNVNYTLSKEPTSINGVNTVNSNFYITFDSDSYSGDYILDNSAIYTYNNKDLLTKDGTYSFNISDKAGNVTSFTIKKDTIVEFTAYESQTNNTVYNGAVSNNGNVVISGAQGEYVKVVKAWLNSVERDVSSSYNDNGKWELLIEDLVGNQTYFMFYIYTHTISRLAYFTPYNYKFKTILYTDLSGNASNYIDKVIDNAYYDSITFEENGEYYVEMLSSATNQIITFEISISNLTPDVKLVGVENDGSTNKDVTLTGYKLGDIIRIYKDGTLTNTITVISATQASPVISEKGEYTVEITNEEGNVTTLHFRRQYTANAASSTVIVVVLSVIAVVLFIGLFSRKREKID